MTSKYDFNDHFNKGWENLDESEKAMARLMGKEDTQKLVAKYRDKPDVLLAIVQDASRQAAEHLQREREKKQKAAEAAATRPWWDQ